MGNQHDTSRNSVRRPVVPTLERTRVKPEQQEAIDLDEIVEQWIWYMWNRTKTKSLSHYKREELIIAINWKRVIFEQSNTSYYGSPPVRLPKSQVLFRTNFNNKTTNEQSYTFKTERYTHSTFKFTFTNRLTKSQESVVIFSLPEEIVEMGGGIKREQNVEFGQDTVKEYDMRWSVNSLINVPPRTRILAELNIDEEEFNGDFSVYIRFYGRITATIAARQSPNAYLKFFDGDIVQIIRETMENYPRRWSGLEIIEDNPPVVQFTMRGKCSFRYGIKQHVVLNQESLNQFLSSFLTPNYNASISSNYRPLRSYVASSNSDIHLSIDDDERI